MAYIVDTHCDSISRVLENESLRRNRGHLDLERMAGIIKLQFFALFVETQFKPDLALERTLELLDKFLHQLSENEELLTLVRSQDDLQQLDRSDNAKCGALLSIEGGEGIKDLYVLRHLFRLGVRSVGLTWNQRNHLADGAYISHRGGGLTEFGRQVILEMNRLGMLVDAAHMAPRSFWDVLRVSRQPIIVSHANCRALCDHPRNLTDLQLKALAAHDGVVCITFAPQFLTEGEASLENILHHIEYACYRIGVEHVGLGSDFDGVDALPGGIDGVQDYYKIPKGLSERGFTQQEIDAICGGNVLKLLAKVLPKNQSGE
ncbi:MAG: membrane dipeptidase [Thermoanaerobacteraceae bacterium]|nr:membrane dipeptidase [Thermoanaerobacteraceae bacterium]